MTNECAGIIASCITTAGGLIAFFTGLFFQNRNSKYLSKERFFYELFPRRLKLYEDICLWIDDNSYSQFDDKNEELKRIKLSLLSLTTRSQMYGSEEITDMLNQFIDFIQIYTKQNMNDDVILKEFRSGCAIRYDKIFDYLSSVSFPPFIEDVLKPFDEENKKLQEHKKAQSHPSSEKEI